MERGDQRAWVWDKDAAFRADFSKLISRAKRNLERAERSFALGEGEVVTEDLADAANLSMLAYSTMCAIAEWTGRQKGCAKLWDGSHDIFDGRPAREEGRP